MEFKQLEIEPEGSRMQRMVKSAQFKRSLIFAAIGAVGGLGYFYLTIGKTMDVISIYDIVKSMAIGGIFGFFITNSPCARGRC